MRSVRTVLPIQSANSPTLPVYVYAPDAPGNYPLLVWSHGSGGSPNQQQAMMSFLVSQGFVVAAPVHADSLERKEIDSGSQNILDYTSRALDVSHTLDNVGRYASLFGDIKIDASHPIVGGHSQGALASQMILGMVLYPDDGSAPIRLGDPRFVAGLMLSPQGSERAHIDERSWAETTAPRLYITGSADITPAERDAADRLDPFYLSPTGDKHLAFFTGAAHDSFTGKQATDNATEADIWAQEQLLIADWFQAIRSGTTTSFGKTLTQLQLASEGRLSVVDGVDGTPSMRISTDANLIGGDGGDKLTATSTVTILAGRGGNDTLTGGSSGDVLSGGLGDDVIVGNGGRDTAQFLQAHTLYSHSGSVAMTVVVGPDGRDQLSSVERLQFADGTLLLDLSGNAPTAYRLYRAALARQPDEAGLMVQTQALDSGTAPIQLAQNFLNSAEFKTLYGAAPSDTAYVTALYTNVLGRVADPGGYAAQVAALGAGTSRAQLLLNFSESPENKTATSPWTTDGIFLL